MISLAEEIKGVTNVKYMFFGQGALCKLEEVIERRRTPSESGAVFLIDDELKTRSYLEDALPITPEDLLIYVSTAKEPTTAQIDSLKQKVVQSLESDPCAVVGIGGGSVLDCAKALSNLLTNPGKASDYQGWDLVQNKGIYKIGIPTLSGTGAEATRTCVMTNPQSGVKLGMNSDFSVFDEVILDPVLTVTVPREQYFFSGMDAYVHCIESLAGRYRHPVGDTYSQSVVSICKEVFTHDEMMSEENRSKLMVASYLGGSAIGMTMVGLVHPFSAGLSVVLGTRHCISNCIVMRAMEQFYPDAFQVFMTMVEKQEIEIPNRICSDLSDQKYDELYAATIVHEKPLINALGPNFRETLLPSEVRRIFETL